MGGIFFPVISFKEKIQTGPNLDSEKTKLSYYTMIANILIC